MKNTVLSLFHYANSFYTINEILLERSSIISLKSYETLPTTFNVTWRAWILDVFFLQILLQTCQNVAKMGGPLT